MEGKVYLKKNNKIGRIIFFHPKGNSLSSLLLHQMENCFLEAEKDSDVRVIVLESIGNAFCGGAYLSELKKIRTLEKSTEFFMCFADLLNTMRKMSKFILARVQGKTVGGGVGILAACDYVIGTKESLLKLSELSIGLGPYIIEPVVKRKIGSAAFSQLSIESNKWKSAQWGLNKGIHSVIVDDLVELNQSITENANMLASYSMEALKKLRYMHWKDTKEWETILPENAKITAELALSKFTQKIINSY